MWGKAIQWAWCRERHIQNSLFRGEEPRERQGVAKVSEKKGEGYPWVIQYIYSVFISEARWPDCSN